jgi:hypothetical protein
MHTDPGHSLRYGLRTNDDGPLTLQRAELRNL